MGDGVGGGRWVVGGAPLISPRGARLIAGGRPCDAGRSPRTRTRRAQLLLRMLASCASLLRVRACRLLELRGSGQHHLCGWRLQRPGRMCATYELGSANRAWARCAHVNPDKSSSQARRNRVRQGQHITCNRSAIRLAGWTARRLYYAARGGVRDRPRTRRGSARRPQTRADRRRAFAECARPRWMQAARTRTAPIGGRENSVGIHESSRAAGRWARALETVTRRCAGWCRVVQSTTRLVGASGCASRPRPHLMRPTSVGSAGRAI